MKRAITGAAALAAIGLVLSACTSTPKSTTPSTPSTTQSATSAPATTPSATPTQSSPPVATGRVLVVSGTYAQETGEAPGELFTRLHAGTAYASASGYSEYDQEGGFRELQVLVTNVGGLAGHQVTVSVNGHVVGTMTVSSVGRAFGEWDTEHGQSVPTVTVGSKVQVKTG